MYDVAIDKLRHKEAISQLEWDLKHKFDFSDILAEAMMKRIRCFLEENSSQDLSVGEVPYWAVRMTEESGKSMAEMEKGRTKLTLFHPDDLDVLRTQGIKALRQNKIMRMTIESKDQGYYLTQEDLALLLCSTPRTIRNDIMELRGKGIAIPTRGQMKDIGKGVSHKAKIVEEYLKGYEYSEIKRRIHHSEDSIDRYIVDFTRVNYLTIKGEVLLKIRQVTRLSERLIKEYQVLYERFSTKDCPRLQQMMAQFSFEMKKRGEGVKQ